MILLGKLNFGGKLNSCATAFMHCTGKMQPLQRGAKAVTSELAVASDFDTQHAVAAAAALVHLGLCAVP